MRIDTLLRRSWYAVALAVTVASTSGGAVSAQQINQASLDPTRGLLRSTDDSQAGEAVYTARLASATSVDAAEPDHYQGHTTAELKKIGKRTYNNKLYGHTTTEKASIYNSLKPLKEEAVKVYMRSISRHVARHDRPRRAYSSLTQKGKSAVRDYNRVTKASYSSPSDECARPPCPLSGQKTTTTADITCWTWEPAQVAYRNLLGEPLFWYMMRMDWCEDGTNIVIRADAGQPWADMTTLPLWSFSNRVFEKAGGVGRSYFSAFGQGEFKWCVTQFGCAFTISPWMRMTANGDGSYDFAWGGGW